MGTEDQQARADREQGIATAVMTWRDEENRRGEDANGKNALLRNLFARSKTVV